MTNQKLILVRGLPGSGKSTFSKYLVSLAPGKIAHREADMYFEIGGEYKYDPARIRNAHEWCQDETEFLLERGLTVIVSNTFTRHWEMECYKSIAKERGIPVSIMTMNGKYNNIHGVPSEVVAKMAARWEN